MPASGQAVYDPDRPAPDETTMRLRRKPILLTLIALLLSAWFAMGTWHVYKPMPGGLDVATPWVPAVDVTFLADTTYVTPTGDTRSDQAIFDAMLDRKSVV